MKIYIQRQPYFHQIELVEAYHMYLPGHVRQHISYKNAKKYYRMVDYLFTIMHAGAESAK